MTQPDEEPVSTAAVVNTPAFADAVLAGGIAVLLLWPVTKAISLLRRRRPTTS